MVMGTKALAFNLKKLLPFKELGVARQNVPVLFMSGNTVHGTILPLLAATHTCAATATASSRVGAAASATEVRTTSGPTTLQSAELAHAQAPEPLWATRMSALPHSKKHSILHHIEQNIMSSYQHKVVL